MPIPEFQIKQALYVYHTYICRQISRIKYSEALALHEANKRSLGRYIKDNVTAKLILELQEVRINLLLQRETQNFDLTRIKRDIDIASSREKESFLVDILRFIYFDISSARGVSYNNVNFSPVQKISDLWFLYATNSLQVKLKILNDNATDIKIHPIKVKANKFKLQKFHEILERSDLSMSFIKLCAVDSNNERFVETYLGLALFFSRKKEYNEAFVVISRCLNIEKPKGIQESEATLNNLINICSKEQNLLASFFMILIISRRLNRPSLLIEWWLNRVSTGQAPQKEAFELLNIVRMLKVRELINEQKRYFNTAVETGCLRRLAQSAKVYGQFLDFTFSEKNLSIVESEYINKIVCKKRKQDKCGEIEKLVLCVNHLKYSERHTHYRVVCSVVDSLLKKNKLKEVHIVITHESETSEAYPLMLPKIYDDCYGEEIKAAIKGLIESDKNDIVRTHVLSNLRDKEECPVEHSLDFIRKLQPDFILCMAGTRLGGINSSYFVKKSLYFEFPIGVFQSQVINYIDEFCDVVFSRTKNKLSGTVDDQKVFQVAYPVLKKHGPLREYFQKHNYNDLKIEKKKGEVFLVSAWKSGRLENKLNKYSFSDLNEMYGVLKKNPSAKWFFLGVNNYNRFYRIISKHSGLKKMIDKKRIISSEFVTNFPEVVKQCDLFLNLPMITGGAGGASVARSFGVPVLAFSDSDVGVNNLEELTFSPEEPSRFFDCAQKLIRDEKLRHSLGVETYKFWKRRREMNTAIVAEQWFDVMKIGLSNFKKRQIKKSENLSLDTVALER